MPQKRREKQHFLKFQKGAPKSVIPPVQSAVKTAFPGGSAKVSGKLIPQRLHSAKNEPFS